MHDLLTWFQSTTVGRASGDVLLGLLVIALCGALYLYDNAQYNTRMGYTRPKRPYNKRRTRG